jgi:hypothetical protein
MARASQVNDVEIVLVDQSVEVNIAEAEGWRGSPVTQKPIFDLFGSQGFFE